MLCIACSKYTALPLVTWDYWEIDQNGFPKRLIWKELLFVYEAFQSVIQIKVAEAPFNKVEGCSLFLNRLFAKSFMTRAESTANNGTMEI